jgi:hypothetical protein
VTKSSANAGSTEKKSVTRTSPVRDGGGQLEDPVMSVTPASIDSDHYAWILQQSRALRTHQPAILDWKNLAEELDAMARYQERALESQLRRVVAHLLKWAYQPNRRSGSWEASIENGRDDVAQQLEDSPSLKSRLNDILEFAYRRARRTAGADMGLDKRAWEKRLPDRCPWTLEQVQDQDFWPEPADDSQDN